MDQQRRHEIAGAVLERQWRAYQAGLISRAEYLKRIVELSRWEYREALDALAER